MTDKEYNEACFERAYMAWKRRERTTEPDPENYRISPARGQEIAHRLHVLFEKTVVNRTLNRENAS